VLNGVHHILDRDKFSRLVIAYPHMGDLTYSLNLARQDPPATSSDYVQLMTSLGGGRQAH
jgi:hypothetical protein